MTTIITIKLTFRGTNIKWNGEGLYHLEWIGENAVYVRLITLEQVEKVFKDHGIPTYVEYADLEKTKVQH